MPTIIKPVAVSGRAVTNRGVHLQPFGFHGVWLNNAEYWLGLMVGMHMSWCVALSESDSLYTSGAAEALLDAGIIPIVRFAYKFPRSWTELRSVEQLVSLYARYGAPLIVQVGNEPFDPREWVNGHIPPPDQAWRLIAACWESAARHIVARGAFAGFPDGPCYTRNPFNEIRNTWDLWHAGQAVYLGHHYGKGRPVDYPYDDVSQNGTPLTMDEYRAALDDYADDHAWLDMRIEEINALRLAWARPGNTAIQDDTCFRGWEKVLHWSRQSLGIDVQIALTEGGWVPRDRAGSSIVDCRWPHTTPRMVARKTLEMMQASTPLFAICPWLLADGDMGGGDGWAFDAWHGWPMQIGMECKSR
jgi:hypothetical protein